MALTIPPALLPVACTITPGETRLGARSVAELAAEFGTPLYVYDAATLRAGARAVQAAFAPLGARISFAVKACSTLAVLQCFQASGLDADVVSAGELVAALRAGFRPEQLHLHGNCKSRWEIQLALEIGVRAIVADSVDELLLLRAMASSLGAVVPVMVRLALPLEAETHPWLQTSGSGSKFGIREGPEEDRVIQLLREGSCFRFIGLHAHIGSQITDAAIYGRAIQQLAARAQRYARAGLSCEEISIGGGWAVAYREGDAFLAAQTVAAAVAPFVSALGGARLAVEPGRALVARAAVAVYRVGAVKDGPSGRIVAVDGGMGDNPRPALYGARYTAFLPDGAGRASAGKTDIVGRYCESGDVLARGVELPAVEAGDLLCIPVAGAYQLSMASDYNLVPPPAVLMVDGSEARLITRRATIDDLLGREILDVESSASSV